MGNDDLGALECRWVIGCDCWYDTDDDYDYDDKDNLCAVKCRWLIGGDCWYDTAYNHNHHHHYYNYSQGMDEGFHLVLQ